jgi:hypothetical protein
MAQRGGLMNKLSAFSENTGEYFAVGQLLRSPLHLPWLGAALEA